MKKRATEIFEGKEVFKNGKFDNFCTLKTIISDQENKLSELLSIKLSAYNVDAINQYNIETKRFITNFTNHNGLDLLLTQYNKKTKKTEVYTPYSDPGYNVFVNLLLAYYETHKKYPNIDFSRVDSEGRNKQDRRDMPLKNHVDGIRIDHGVCMYLEHKDLFKKDDEGIFRGVIEGESKDMREGIGFKDDTSIIKINNFSIWGRDPEKNNSTIIVENELIPLYMQAYLDITLRTGGSRNAGNIQKLYEMITYLLENPEIINNKEINGSRVARENTPLTQR